LRLLQGERRLGSLCPHEARNFASISRWRLAVSRAL
jgi:hypothetical protein